MSPHDPIRKYEPRDVRWLWERHVPAGMISALAGPAGVGKSLLSFRIAADVSQHHNVIVSSLEERLHETLRPRLEASGANLDRVFNPEPRLDPLPKGFEQLAASVTELDAKLIVLDPVVMHLAVPPSNPAGIRAALDPLDRLCEETGCSALIVTHQLKQASRDSAPLLTVGGPVSGLVGLCRAVFIVGRNPREPDELAMAPAKFNIGEAPTPLGFMMNTAGGILGPGPEVGFLTLRGECGVTARQLVRSQYDERSTEPVASKAERAAEWLSRFLWGAKTPQKPADVVAMAQREDPPISTRQLKRAAQELGVAPRSGNRHTKWELPTELREMLDSEYSSNA